MIIMAYKDYNNRIQVHCYVAYIQRCLLSEHKHSKQNDDNYTVQYVSAQKPSSAVHTQFTTANSKDEVECPAWNVSKSIVHRNAGLE